MGFWGWRQMAWMVFISVIVVACTDAAPTPRQTATPTPRPITLTIQGSPGAPPATVRPTLAAITATPKEPDAAPVDILSPNCTDTSSDGYQCIGLVHNTTGASHGTLLVHAELYNGDDIVETQTVAVEQRLLRPDERAPYRLIFERSADGPLILAISNAFPAGGGMVMVETENEAGEVRNGEYVLSAVLVNTNDFALDDVRVVAALYRGDDLVGYRVVEVGGMDAGAEAEVALRWYGITDGSAYAGTLAAAGIKSPSK